MIRSGRSAGEKMAMITLEDRHGSLDGVVFSTVFAKEAANLQSQAVVMLLGRTDRSRGRLQLIVDRVVPIAEAARHFTSRIDLVFDGDSGVDEAELVNDMRMASGLLQQAAAVSVSGRGHAAEIGLIVRSGGMTVRMRTPKLRVVPEPDLLRRLGEVIGHDRIRLVGGHVPALTDRGPRRGPPSRQPAMAG